MTDDSFFRSARRLCREQPESTSKEEKPCKKISSEEESAEWHADAKALEAARIEDHKSSPISAERVCDWNSAEIALLRSQAAAIARAQRGKHPICSLSSFILARAGPKRGPSR